MTDRGAQQYYRETVSPWSRSVFVLQPDIESMAEASPTFQVHTRSACCCSRSGRSRGWCTRSPGRWARCSARTARPVDPRWRS
jgi:hypothetical protein